jgi:hypothetical protein
VVGALSIMRILAMLVDVDLVGVRGDPDRSADRSEALRPTAAPSA